jgi:ABC-type multidrug transport system fused ATPase/permease subunit
VQYYEKRAYDRGRFFGLIANGFESSRSIRRLVEFSEQFNRGITGIERFTEVMDVVSEIKDSENALEIENVRVK